MSSSWTRIGLWGATAASAAEVSAALWLSSSGPAWGWIVASAGSIAGTAAAWALLRREAESESREKGYKAQGRWLHSLTENPVWAMLVLDERGCVQKMNTAAEKMLGYASREILGRERFGRFFCPEEVNEELANVRREYGQPFIDLAEVLRYRLQNASANTERSWTIVRKDGLRLRLVYQFLPYKTRVGGLPGLFWCCAMRVKSSACGEALKQSAAGSKSFFNMLPPRSHCWIASLVTLQRVVVG